jgi:hypothetical protein
MRLLLAILMLALIIAMGATHAEVPASSTVSALAALCKSDMKNCEDQIGVIIMTGVQAQKIPSCTIRLNLTELTGKILDWWQAHPDQAANPNVLGVANALYAIKPC